ncbi:hypothetical protein BKA69DRAFT_1110611 [Paraphysoderma sedebokerense]|nr:hypothetical protein BKA69DRAFT_1110611 [Paraphysoderma sedebokerense]
MKMHSCYDMLPVSFKVVVLDSTLLVKKGVAALIQNGLQAAPLWDSVRQKFDGMLTLRDVVQLIQHFCVNLSYQQAHEELEIFQIQNLRDLPNRQTSSITAQHHLSLNPLKSVFEAAKLLVTSRLDRIALVDHDLETNLETVVGVIDVTKILKFLACNSPPSNSLLCPLSALQIGTYKDIAKASLNTPFIDVLNMFIDHDISCIPIVDDSNILLNVVELDDVLSLLSPNMSSFDNDSPLSIPLSSILLARTADFSGVHTCTLSDTLHSILHTIKNCQVNRFVVVDDEKKLVGILSLRDLLRSILENEGGKHVKQPQ